MITKELVDSKEMINVKYNFENKWVQIKLDTNERSIKYDLTLDFTIIDIGDLIKQKYFLFLNVNNIDYINQKIYIPQYPEGNKLSFSEVKIIKINIENDELVYDASTKSGSSGSPILLKDTTEIIWIHKQGNTKTRKENYGTLIIIKTYVNPLSPYTLFENNDFIPFHFYILISNSIIEFIQSKNNKSKKSNENISIIKDNQKNEIICIYNKQKDEIDLLYNYSRDIYRR